ncbi:MAG: hypothetical protein AAGC67_07750 [Myxococcota bacterium]
MGGSSDSGIELAFAIAHEVGNHLGGIRLQAHLLDDELDAREMAEASLLIDGLAGRSGPLLSLLRPLLSDDWRRTGGATWAGLLGRVARQIEDEGTRGVRFEVAGGLDPEAKAPDFDWVHPLLIALVESTLEHVADRGATASVRLALVEDEEGLRLDLVDDGAPEDLSPGAARRGRPLAVEIAQELIGRSGGRVETQVDDAGTRVGLRFG